MGKEIIQAKYHGCSVQDYYSQKYDFSFSHS